MMKVPEPSPATLKQYEAIAADLAAAGAVSSAMFGMPSLKLGGKAFAGVFGDQLVFKLTGEAHARALGLSGSVLFDPSGMGRAMKEWVVVPRAHAKQWPQLASAALSYAGDHLARAARKPKKPETAARRRKS